MKKIWFGGALLLAVGALYGGEVLIEASDPGDFGTNPVMTADADGNLIPGSGKTYITAKSVPVDFDKKYVISFECKGGDDNTETAVAAVVAIPCDAKGRRIHGGFVDRLPGTETTLAKEIKVGDTEAVISANKAWSAAMKRKSSYAVAFNVKKDFSDLPNRELLNVKSQKIDEDGNIVVKFTTKSKRKYEAGTAVRLQRHGWNGVGKVAKSGKEWQKITFTIQGTSDRALGTKWWPGTKSAKLGIYGDRRNGANEILIRNFKMEEGD